MAFVESFRGGGVSISDAELADVLEAVIWERARAVWNGREWREVADEMAKSIEATWPASLCSTDTAATVGVKLTPKALLRRFERLANKREPLPQIRRRAIRILAQAGQIASPPDAMTLWQFFKPSENVLVNKGSLAAKEKALAAGKKRRRSDAHAAKKKSKSAAPAPPPPTRPPPSNRPPPINIPTEDVADDAATPPTETAPTDTLEGLMQSEQRVCLSGLKRGLAGGVENGQGRGGKIQHATKVGIRDLVVADHVPVRDVPKVLVDAQVILAQQRPEANEIITHSHIADWICELGAEELYDDWAEFWSVRREFGPLIVLHVSHDGSRRRDRKLGRHAELMQFRASYFNPRPHVNRAVESVEPQEKPPAKKRQRKGQK